MGTPALVFTQLTQTGGRLAEQAFTIYEQSFDADQRVPLSWFDARFENTPAAGYRWGCWAAVRRGQAVGFATSTYVAATRCGFIGYLAVASAERGQGVGSQMLRWLQEQFMRDAQHLQTGPPRALILEIERGSSEEHHQRARFYERLGGHILHEVDYTIPPLANVTPSMPLHPVIIPSAGEELTTDLLSTMLETLYTYIYQLDVQHPYYQQARATLPGYGSK